MTPFKISFRTQAVLIAVLCLGLLGMSVLFLNAYLIAGLKEQMKNQARLLAEETGEQVRHLFETREALSAADAGKNPRLAEEIRITLRGKNNVMAACVFDAEGNLVFSEVGANPDLARFSQSDEGVRAVFNTGDFSSLEIYLQKSHPDLATVEIPIDRKDRAKGSIRFLISETGIYDDIRATGRQITRHLWGVIFAFFGVLMLGLYLMARLFRRQLRLLEINERLDRMAYVGTLASGLAHEIRNPLNAMSVNLSVAEEELTAGQEGSPEIAHRALGMIRREVDRLNRSVTHFMEFALPHHHRREEMDLRPVVNEVMALLRQRIEESGVETRIELPDDTRLKADFSGLRQVLYNVALNALQALADQKNGIRRLAIGGRRESAQWLLWVDDSGPGVPPGEEEKIFEVFHSTKAAGSGFGLAIARAIVKSHGGEIFARRSETGGLRMEIALPETGPHWH